MSGAILTASSLTSSVDVSCDVCVIGSGAGGAVLAAGLAEKGADVVILEEGSHRTRKDWIALRSDVSYPMLYQERGTRATADQAIAVLQGRSVGGSTTVNWTTCFRTPDRVLSDWRSRFGTVLDAEELGPHWEAVEKRLNIHPWPEVLVNPNNHALMQGCQALGWEFEVLRRNVDGCVGSGYCGLGCPIDAKQAMHLTYIPDAIKAGARLFADTRAERLAEEGGRIVAVHGVVMDPARDVPGEVRVTVRPKLVAVCGGAINSPALLLRSGLNEGPTGKRTFLHPVIPMSGVYEHRIDGWYGAPQSVSSHQFIDRGPGKVGFFLEVAPMQPALTSNAAIAFGIDQQAYMGDLAHTCGMIALSMDGRLPGDEGGTVTLRADGRPKLEYPVKPHLTEAFRAAMRAMAQVHLAAGAMAVRTPHHEPVVITGEADLQKLDAAAYGAHEHSIFTAHQMGGCTMGIDPYKSVVNTSLRHHRVPNLYVVDGSVLPTSLGVNPSLTIYGIAHWATDQVAAVI